LTLLAFPAILILPMDGPRTSSVSAILLAAGKSVRMGQNKLLMPFDGGTIIGRTLDNLIRSQAGEIIVVLGAKATEIRAVIGERKVVTVLNPDYARGMSTSLQTGLNMVSKLTRFILVALGDQPLITTRTFDRLIEAALASDKGLIVPVYRGRRGNPITLSAGYIPDIRRFTGDVGGRELLARYPGDVLEVSVDDPGVLVNINTLDEYTRLVGR
jgi:molybdenum cofactor cytidylyltransferase